MKKFFFTLFALIQLFAISVGAKTIHWLTFIDTTDGNVGVIDQNTRAILYGRWINLVNAVVQENGYTPHIIDIYGTETSPEKCKEVVSSLQCSSPDDIIVFYYVGHGTENTNTSKFPLMLMAQTNMSKFVPLSWVHETLKKKSARLTITIGMCCNARQGVTGRTAPAFSVNYGNTYVDDETAQSIRKMFLDFKGDLIVTSASPNESSWACDSQLGPTDYFSFELVKQFNVDLPEGTNLSWGEMLSSLQKNVSSNVKNCVPIQRRHPGTTQTPIWIDNLTLANAPKKTIQEEPKEGTNSTTSQNEKSEGLMTLNKILGYISSSSVEELKRIEFAEKCNSLFTNDAVVRVVAQDGNTIVDKENISSFLGRISTSRLLMTVSALDYSTNGSRQINELKVREVYKK